LFIKRVRLLPGFEIREYFTPLLVKERVHLLPRKKIIIWSPGDKIKQGTGEFGFLTFSRALCFIRAVKHGASAQLKVFSTVL